MLVYPLMIGVWEIVAIVFIIVLLVGGKKIPELMKGVGKGVKSFKEGLVGKGVKSFKEGLNGIEDEVNRSGAPSSGQEKEASKSADSAKGKGAGDESGTSAA